MQTRRVGTALQGGAPPPAEEFPGLRLPEPDRRGFWLGGGVALLVHAGLFAGLLLATWLAPPEMVEEIVHEVRLLREQPAPEPAPRPEPRPAPAPKALAERRTIRFAPQAQAVRPQVVNPTVVARAAPEVEARALEMNRVARVEGPREIRRAPRLAPSVRPVQPVAAATAERIAVGTTGGPVLRGPVELDAPTAPSVGPRAIAVEGATVGTGTAVAVPGGSSVEEGIVTGRDVLGAPDGAPLARVDTRVGEGLLAGGGAGDGTGEGSGGLACTDRPEVNQYLQNVVRPRILSRWVASGTRGQHRVLVRMSIDAAGSLRSVQLVESSDPRVNQQALDAIRSASPFPPLPERARCLARHAFLARFKLTSEG